jgi:hypothetical protein
MKRMFGISAMYIIYLLVLGQECSALKSVDHIIAVPIPTFKSLAKVTSPALKPISFTEAPKLKANAAPEILTKISKKLVLDKRVSLPLREVQKPKIINKKYEIAEIESYELKDLHIVSPTSKNLVNEDNKELTLDEGIEHFGFEVETRVKIVQWSPALEGIIAEKLSLLAKGETQANQQVSGFDTVTSHQSALETKAEAYDPADPKMLTMFNRNELDLNLIKKEEKSVETKKEDELVFIDYSNEENNLEKGIAAVAATPISQSVKRVIEREMGPADNSVVQNLLAVSSFNRNDRKQKNKEDTGTDTFSEKSNSKSEITLHTVEANLNKGFSETVHNFNFIPSYDTNEVVDDFNEGSLSFDYSLKNNTGILRGVIVKNHFIRTTFEIALGGEYSKFEIPMVSQDSIQAYLDENKLEGYGGFYLADLGEFLEDVELEKFSNEKKTVYEHRLLLDDNFKKVADGQGFRYILFIGVEPGNINVRYLGVNGQQTSKITFVAPEELTYDFSQLERPIDYKVQTKLQNTLGKTPTILDMDPQNIINFISDNQSKKLAPGEYLFSTPWKVKGSRSYFELAYMEDSIFVGIDGDKNLELPSTDFIGEVLRSFNMDGLNQECLVQINLEEPIKEIKILGESFRGPSVFDHAYLDKDGVFSAELSPMTEKLFLLGSEEGIFNLKIEYESGLTDYLRTYCSPSTYLLEQLCFFTNLSKFFGYLRLSF